jgi:hypothetical protein
MRRVEDFLKHAAECRRLARGIADQEKQKTLLVMADTWEALAREREKKKPSEPDAEVPS